MKEILVKLPCINFVSYYHGVVRQFRIDKTPICEIVKMVECVNSGNYTFEHGTMNVWVDPSNIPADATLIVSWGMGKMKRARHASKFTR